MEITKVLEEFLHIYNLIAGMPDCFDSDCQKGFVKEILTKEKDAVLNEIIECYCDEEEITESDTEYIQRFRDLNLPPITTKDMWYILGWYICKFEIAYIEDINLEAVVKKACEVGANNDTPIVRDILTKAVFSEVGVNDIDEFLNLCVK